MTVTVNASSLLRNYPPNSAPLNISTPPLQGNFGPNDLSLLSVSARDPTGSSPVLNNGDTVTMTFNKETNGGGFGIGTLLTKSDLATIVTFSQSLGNGYVGTWLNRRQLEITCTDVTGNGVPVLGVFTMGVLASGNVRNYPPASVPSDHQSPVLSGDFGPSPIQVVSVVANDPVDLIDTFNSGDELFVTFSQATDKGGLPDILTKAHIDSLLRFSASLGADYTGEWLSDRKIKITCVDATGNGGPQIEATTVQVLESGQLRNTPPQCAPTSTVSPPISGDWGILYPHISTLVANDPTDRNSVYSFLDTIEITFSINTNRGGKQNGDVLSRSDILNQFSFNQVP